MHWICKGLALHGLSRKDKTKALYSLTQTDMHSALYGIIAIERGNRYLVEVYRPAFNAEFMQPATEKGPAFVPWVGAHLDNVLYEQFKSDSSLC